MSVELWAASGVTGPWAEGRTAGTCRQLVSLPGWGGVRGSRWILYSIPTTASTATLKLLTVHYILRSRQF